MQRLPKAAMKRHPGWNFSGFGASTFSGATSLRGLDEGTSGFKSSMMECDEGVAMVLLAMNKVRWRLNYISKVYTRLALSYSTAASSSLSIAFWAEYFHKDTKSRYTCFMSGLQDKQPDEQAACPTWWQNKGTPFPTVGPCGTTFGLKTPSPGFASSALRYRCKPRSREGCNVRSDDKRRQRFG